MLTAKPQGEVQSFDWQYGILRMRDFKDFFPLPPTACYKKQVSFFILCSDSVPNAARAASNSESSCKFFTQYILYALHKC